MNRALLTAAAVGALALSAPAFAQSGLLGLGAGASVDARIDQSVRAGGLSVTDAARLRADARALTDLENRYRVDGIQDAERRDLERRYQELDARLNVDARGYGPGDGNGYGPGPGYEQGRGPGYDQGRGPGYDNGPGPGYGAGDARGNGGVNGYQSINARLPQLERRIDQGLRNGAISGQEAVRLRAEVRAIADLDARYRATGGLDARERQDLDRRFELVSARIRIERADSGDGMNINARQAQLEARIDQAVRRRALSVNDAGRLRADFRAIAMLESRYRASGGLDPRERQDLDRRFDGLEARLRVQLADRNFRWDDRRYR